MKRIIVLIGVMLAGLSQIATANPIVSNRECIASQSWDTTTTPTLSITTGATMNNSYSAACNLAVVNTNTPLNPLTVTNPNVNGSGSWGWALNCALMVFSLPGTVAGGLMVGETVAVHYQVNGPSFVQAVAYVMVPNNPAGVCTTNNSWTGTSVGVLNPLGVS